MVVLGGCFGVLFGSQHRARRTETSLARERKQMRPQRPPRHPPRYTWCCSASAPEGRAASWIAGRCLPRSGQPLLSNPTLAESVPTSGRQRPPVPHARRERRPRSVGVQKMCSWSRCIQGRSLCEPGAEASRATCAPSSGGHLRPPAHALRRPTLGCPLGNVRRRHCAASASVWELIPRAAAGEFGLTCLPDPRRLCAGGPIGQSGWGGARPRRS